MALLLAAAEEFGYRGVGRVDMWLHGGSGDMVVMVVTIIVVVLVLPLLMPLLMLMLMLMLLLREL